MLAKAITCAVIGLDGVIVEVDISPGFPSFTVVGLLDAAVQEARERVSAPSETPRAIFRYGASPRTWRRLTCARPGTLTTCPSRWRSC